MTDNKEQQNFKNLKAEIHLKRFLDKCFTINKNNTQDYFVSCFKGINI